MNIIMYLANLTLSKNKECHDWKELEEFKPTVQNEIESLNLFKKGGWKSKGKEKKQKVQERCDTY